MSSIHQTIEKNKRAPLVPFWAFSVAQPIYSILSQNVEFFINRDAQLLDLILCVAGGFLLPPLLMQVVIGQIDHRFGKRIADHLHHSILAFLILLFIVQITHSPNVYVLLGIALVAWPLVFLLLQKISKQPAFYLFFRVLSILSIGFILSFFLEKDVRAYISRNLPNFQSVQTQTTTQINAPVPIIMIIFDELPLGSLLDEDGQMNARLFPNFSTLAKHSDWYRHTAAVSSFTTSAVPAILSGMLPKDAGQARLPLLVDYPNNLFTFLGKNYTYHVEEARSRLCPDALCERKLPPFLERMGALLPDIVNLYLHIVLPPDLTGHLPDVSQAEGGTLLKKPLKGDLFLDFVNQIDINQNGKKPPLHLLHIELPHHPFVYLPSGKMYESHLEQYMDGLLKFPVNGYWKKDEWLATQAQQRHLLQTVYTDKLLGQLIQQLKKRNLYDQSLIIVVADHGISFTPGRYARVVTARNAPDIMPVPFIMKRPNQQEGRVIDRYAQTVDILPTIAAVLKTTLPWRTDGQSLLEPKSPDFKEKTDLLIYNTSQIPVKVSAKALFSHQRLTENKTRRFGDLQSVNDLFKVNPSHRQLLNQPTRRFESKEALNVLTRIQNHVAYTDVDTGQPTLPARLQGSLHFKTDNTPKNAYDIAISINGVIQAITQSVPTEHKNSWHFSAMLPENALSTGNNKLEIYLIQNKGNSLVLQKTTTPNPVSYRLIMENNQTTSIKSGQTTYRLSDLSGVSGIFKSEYFKTRADRVNICGIINGAKENGRRMIGLTLFKDGRFTHEVQPMQPGEFAHATRLSRGVACGASQSCFYFSVPVDYTESHIRLFALFENRPKQDKREGQKEGGFAVEIPVKLSRTAKDNLSY